MFPFAIGAVVEGVPSTFQTPLSGQVCPVLAVVPNGTFVCVAVAIRLPIETRLLGASSMVCIKSVRRARLT